MLYRNFLSKLSIILMTITLIVGAAPGITYARQGVGANSSPLANTWHPAPARTGMGSIVWTNFVGGGNELTIDMSGTLYKVPPEANNIPGRLQIEVAPGTYAYTASVPFGTVNRTVDVAAGQVIGLGFYGKLDIPTQGAAHPGDEHNPGSHGATHNYDHHNPDAHQAHFTDLLVSQEDFTAPVR